MKTWGEMYCSANNFLFSHDHNDHGRGHVNDDDDRPHCYSPKMQGVGNLTDKKV